jgi:hypothetical protein
MTETEWFAATDAVAMLPAAERVGSARQLRLFMAGVCRRGWDRYGIPAVRRTLETAERYADGEEVGSALAELRVARWVWGLPVEPLLCPIGEIAVGVRRFLAAMRNSSPPLAWDVATRGDWVRHGEAARATLLRDVIDNPWRSTGLENEWLTSTVSLLARQMYEARDFSAMPILADALQDAGCDSDDILNHCRGAGPHVRGCWVVDLVLGK